MSEKRFQKTRIVDKWGGIYDSKTDEILDVNDVEHKLNEQQATIEMYQRRVHKREEQISIIKKHCLKFLTDEQVEIIRKELENE